MESFYLWLIEQIDLPEAGSLLDVACGSGEVVRLAGKRGLKAIGIDISELAAQRARKNLGASSGICVGVGEQLPFPDKCFDFITNIGSLEHFNEPAQGVREMSRVLQIGGKAFLLVPNTFSLLDNIWGAFRTGETPVDYQPIQRYGARTDWTRLLESNGIRVCRVAKYERPYPRTKADWIYYLRRPKHFIRLLAAPFVPLNLSYCFLFTGERVSDD